MQIKEKKKKKGWEGQTNFLYLNIKIFFEIYLNI